MKRFNRYLAVAFGLAFTSVTFADQLSPEEALARIQTGDREKVRLAAGASATPLISVKSKDDKDFTAVYAFRNGDGFILVSADDCATPLLGYGDTEFDPGNMPPQLKGWLDFYASEIYEASKIKGKHIRRASETYPAVAPLITTMWDQDSPYDMYTPVMDGMNTPTGCVATAMAQVMNYHQWPKTGRGYNSYWTSNGLELSLDFSEVTFDWDNMLDEYGADSPEKSNEAVANLMYAAGIAVDMNYDEMSSGASSFRLPYSMYTYFDYDKSMHQAWRYDYSIREWEKLVYNELANKRPVLYGADSNMAGHEFVCDGYDGKGYFHINWGWGGSSNGYFLLTALDPYDQGIGGSLGYDFLYNHDIVLNVMPPQENSKDSNYLIASNNMYIYPGDAINNEGELTSWPLDYGDSVKLGEELLLMGEDGIFNLSATDAVITLAAKFENVETGETLYLKDPDGVTVIAPIMAPGSESIGGWYFTLPVNLEEGQYLLTPGYIPENTGEWVELNYSLGSFFRYVFEVENDEAAIFSVFTEVAMVKEIKFNTPVYLDTNFEAEITFSNPGERACYTEYVMVFLDENQEMCIGDRRLVDLEAGEERTVTYEGRLASEGLFEPGEYFCYVCDYFTGSIIGPDDILQINVQSRPETEADAMVKALNITSGDGTAHVDFQIDITCEKGIFDQSLFLFLWADQEMDDPDSRYSLVDFKGLGTVIVTEGNTESVEVPFEFTPVEGFNTYLSEVVYIDPVTWERVTLGDPCIFTLKTDGIGQVSRNSTLISLKGDEISVICPEGIESAEVYSLNGMLIKKVEGNGDSSLRIPAQTIGSGACVVVVSGLDGSRHREKIVK